MGVVHLARRPGQERVALKVIRPNVVGDDESRARLAREVNSLLRIRSRRVAEIIDADPWGDIPYVATRYVPGYSLYDQVAQEGPLLGDELVWFARCLAQAIEAVHRVGVVHRDIKPSNILMVGRNPVLIDFGLARLADDPRLTAQGWLLGTPGYLAPEILHGEDASPASDIHSWAATVAYAGTGRAPFGSGPSMAIMDRVRRGEHDVSELPEEVQEVVSAGLDPEPRNRPTVAAILTWMELEDEGFAADESDLDPDDGTELVDLHDDTATRPVPLTPFPVTRPYTQVVQAPHEPTTPPVEWWERHEEEWAEDTTVHLPLDSHHEPEPDEEWLHSTPVGDREFAERHDVAEFTDDDPDDGDDLDGDDRYGGDLDGDDLDGDDEVEFTDDPWTAPETPTERVRLGVRLRRATLLLTLGAGVSLAFVAAPYVTTALLTALVWLLRTLSHSMSASAERRRLRGSKWYDGVQSVATTPVHVFSSIPGTLALLLWAAGLSAVAGLICFTVAAPVQSSLLVMGAGLVLGLWVGPGATRVRRAVSPVVRPFAARGWLWLLTWALLVGLLVLLVGDFQGQPTDWSPAVGAPWDNV